MPISGHKVQYGVDTSANPALIENRIYNTDSVNRMYRGGLNQTRPPFKEVRLFFNSVTEERMFRNYNVTGVFGYSGVYPYTSSHIIVTVGPYVFAGQLMNKNAFMNLIWDKLDPLWSNNYFCQAETILVISNGKDDPLFWNGQTNSMQYCKNSRWAKSPMPKFNAMVYAHGRIFGATENGIVYAGDHLYSQGNNASDEVVLSFHEGTYPNSGDGFTAPASWGDLTGMAVVQRNPSANGHGEIVVFHLLGAYAINPLVNRNEWNIAQIQQVLFTGLGGASTESIVPVNNDLYFRCSNRAISSLRETVSDYQNQSALRPFSQEVSKYLSFDNFSHLRYSMSGVSKNRALFTVNHQLEKDDTHNFHHRFALGLVSLDLYRGSVSVPDSRSWDGLWTGLRCTGIASLTIGKERDCYFCSYDRDKTNRIYYISDFAGDDSYFINTGNVRDPVSVTERKIESMYLMENLFDGLGAESRNSIVHAKIENDSIFYSKAIGKVELEGHFNSNFDVNFHSLYDSENIGKVPQEEYCLYDPVNGNWSSSGINNTIERDGFEFGLRTLIKGSVNIHCNILKTSSPSAMSLTKTASCNSDSVTESGYEDSDYDYFSYFII